MNLIEQFEQEQIAKLTKQRAVPDFHPGDTLRVSVKVVEGTRERLQAFEGVCIGRKNAGMSSSFTVRKLSFGEGVERVFPLYSPRIAEIEVVRRGDVRRAKLYYLRGRTGKRARILEKSGLSATAAEMSEAELLGAAPEAQSPEAKAAKTQAKAPEAKAAKPKESKAKAESKPARGEAKAKPAKSEAKAK